ncbi:MAG TPA: hypothetical protein VL728_19555 [Cyclobacteriaceae bacterium]|jgi:hypothetical protein|nr:hypothetical protein [Cyclobacteriaceae bacterium]
MIIYIKILEALKNWLPFLKRNYKTIAFIIAVALVIYLFLRLGHERRRAEDAEAGRDAAIRISNGLSSEVHRYRNKQGDTVSVAQVVTVPKSQIDELLKERDLQWIKKLEGIKKDGSNLQSAIKFDATFDASKIKADPVSVPCPNVSLNLKRYRYKDEWNHISALNIDTLDIRDSYAAALELKRPNGWFWKGFKRFNWGKQWEPVCEITNSNKLIKIDSIAVITVK